MPFLKRRLGAMSLALNFSAGCGAAAASGCTREGWLRGQPFGIIPVVATLTSYACGPDIFIGSAPASSAKWRAFFSLSTFLLNVPTIVTVLPPESVGTKKL